MCTVTFIPVKDGVILTSNRDEHSSRGIALHPEFCQVNGRKIVFPRDSEAGGTWFISNEQGDVGVLLNGAFEKHIPMPPYRKSRGLVLTEIFHSGSPFDALRAYDLAGIENFTIILWEQNHLKEVRWDGYKLLTKNPGAQQAHIWSSATLYDETMIAERHAWFSSWLSGQKVISQTDILNFHSSTHTNNTEYGLRISRSNKIATTSITSLCLEDQQATFYYKDFIQRSESQLEYDLIQVPKTIIPTSPESEIHQKT